MGPATEMIITNRTNYSNGNIKMDQNEQELKNSKRDFEKHKEIIAADEEDTTDNAKLLLPSQIGTDYTFKRKIVWFNAIGFLILHIIACYGIYLQFTRQVSILSVLYNFILMHISGIGVTMGAHRLFSHRAYKASKSLRIVLLILHTMAGQNCLWVWARDHRQHHKYSDTDADPHNASRGFFFSHIGWLMSKKHPKVLEYGKKIDMSDLEADYWVMFQKRYYKTLYVIFALVLPCLIPIFCWNEGIINTIIVTYVTRTVVLLNLTWCVNSVAHIWGYKPFDKNILPVESKLVSSFGLGEGWHNYHHSFPWDYRAAELGTPYNITTKVIDFLAQYGHAYDRKSASAEMIRSRVLRTGDGTHHKYGHHNHIEYPHPDDVAADIKLRKYIVDKKDIGNQMLLNQLEKEFNFNNNDNKEKLKEYLKKDFNLNENISKTTKASLNVAS